ncbi:MAG TPA: hypothetical protein VME67_02730 [Mycobacterium sp.]|nr:hypothetical protein [Mycobacterium sp.]HTX93836.1 hypothetical protein [Mycobacterium sp.]
MSHSRFGRWIGLFGAARRPATNDQAPAPPTVRNDLLSGFTVERLWSGPGPGTGPDNGP